MSKLRLLGHSLWYGLAVSLLVLAITFTVSRALLTMVEDYRADLEILVSEQLGVPVTIGKMGASLRGFQPELRLQNVQVAPGESGEPLLQVREIRVGIDPIQVLSSGKFWPDYLSIVGTRLLIERSDQGRISVAGIPSGPDTPGKGGGKSLAWLMSEGEFEVLDSEILWQDHARDARPLALSHTNIRIINASDLHQVAIQAQLPQSMGQSIRLALQLEGDLAAGGGWGGHAYFEGQALDMAALVDRLPLKKLAVDRGVASIQLWSKWQAAKAIEVVGEVSLNQAHVRRLDAPGELALDQLVTGFRWHAGASGWRLHGYDLFLDADGLSQREGRFSVATVLQDEQLSELVLVGEGLTVQTLSGITLRSGLLPESAQKAVQALQPEGLLNDFQLAIWNNDDGVAWSVCSNLTGTSTQAWRRLPRVRNLSGKACVSDQAGWLAINSRDSEMELPILFREPFQLSQVIGYVDWQRDDTHWRIHSDRLLAVSSDIETLSRIELLVPHGDGKPYMDVQTDFKNAEAASVPRYLPVGIMGEKTVAWLDQAFHGGRVPSGSFVFRGETAEFPFRDHSGVFQVLFQVDDATLNFQDGWPRLQGVGGSVEFKNEALHVYGERGQISGNRIDFAHVTIPDLQHSNHLQVRGSVTDDIAGLYRFFRHSPIAEQIPALLRESEISGPGKIGLDLKIPIRSGHDTVVSATAKVNRAQMRFPAWGLNIQDVSGELIYDQHGLRAVALKGALFGQAVAAKIHSDAAQTMVSAHTSMPLSALAKQYPSRLWKHAEGATAIEVQVRLPKASLGRDAAVELTLSSDLTGVRLNVPAPLGKQPQQALPLLVQLDLGGEKSTPLRFSWADRLQAVIDIGASKAGDLSLRRADFRLGSEAAQLPPKAGIRLSGLMPSLNLDEWMNWGSKAGSSSTQQAGLLNQLDLGAGQVIWSGISLADVHFRGEHLDAAWRGQLTSELATGQVELPDDPANERPIVLTLSRLKLPETEQTDAQDDPGEPKPAFNPSAIPALSIRSDSFLIGETDLGALQAKTHQTPDGLSIDLLSIKSERDRLQLAGGWRLSDGQARTDIAGDLHSDSFGDLLDDLGYTSNLKQTKTDIRFDLDWPAPPYAYRNAILNGTLRMDTEKGRLLDLEPGVGRIFGLLSLGTLQRRLQLDFSDLLQKGMSFDKIRGSYRIDQGQAQTSDFYLDGPAARLDISGRIGLGDRDYDQLVTVTPKTTSSLPVAGAIAGGPVVGAAVFLAQKLLGNKVEKITQYQYQVTGPWEDPQIKQITSPSKDILHKVIDSVTPDLKEGK